MKFCKLLSPKVLLKLEFDTEDQVLSSSYSWVDPSTTLFDGRRHLVYINLINNGTNYVRINQHDDDCDNKGFHEGTENEQQLECIISDGVCVNGCVVKLISCTVRKRAQNKKTLLW